MLRRRTKPSIRELLRRRAASSQGLRTKLYNEWSPELDEALAALPEAELLSHELFRDLMSMSDPERRRILLVTERDRPVAVAGLRNRWGRWEPVTQWIIPGVLFPALEGYLDRVLPALGLEVYVAWWRWDGPPLQTRWIRELRSEPTYGACCREDYEAFWGKSSLLRNVRNIRNRCERFEIKVDLPGATEWTISSWGAKWCPEGHSERPDLAERLLAASYLEERGLCHTLSIHDQERMLAAMTFVIHQNDAVALYNYRDPMYDKQGVMTRLMDFGFSWARDMGLDSVDIGGSFDYKNKWAPPLGAKCTFTVLPTNLLLERRAYQLIRAVSAIGNKSKRQSSDDVAS
jgi:hypothetical protein